jgi:expansin (peptidoglycan-binding protein)
MNPRLRLALALTLALTGASACGDDGPGGAIDGGTARDGGPGPGGDGGPAPGRDAGPGVDAGPVPEIDAGPGAGCAPEPTHEGEGTYYDADGSGNCSFPATPGDLMVAAMNQTDYAGSAVCGACAHITGPSGEVTVRIVDRCPECAPGDIDMSPTAFERIAALSAGRVPIAWTFVPCGVTGPIVYQFKEGSNQWWTAVQVRNHRHAIARFEYRADDGSWREVARETYNYFVEAAGMGPGPYAFRVTDVWGNTLVDEGIPFVENGEVAGAAQLPACE